MSSRGCREPREQTPGARAKYSTANAVVPWGLRRDRATAFAVEVQAVSFPWVQPLRGVTHGYSWATLRVECSYLLGQRAWGIAPGKA